MIRCRQGATVFGFLVFLLVSACAPTKTVTTENRKKGIAARNLGEAYMRVKEFDKTVAMFQKALEIDPGHKMARVRLKELETYRGKQL